MKKAKQMFEELGYLKNDSYGTVGYKNGEKEVVFYPKTKTYECYLFNPEPVKQDVECDNFNIMIDMKLHKAIHQQLIELDFML